VVSHNRSFDEYIDYDKNGNIDRLYRFADQNEYGNVIEIDALGYHYEQHSNKLMKVTDATNFSAGFSDDSDGTNDTDDDYAYDDNGNMISDENKGIGSIKYNHLNLPTEIRFDNGGTISYLYTASGVKVGKIVYQGGNNPVQTDYLGGFQYVNGNLQFFPHPEGYVSVVKFGPDNLVINYAYQYKDHFEGGALKNSPVDYFSERARWRGGHRLNYGKDPETNVLKVLEENHYYPFGLKHQNYNTGRKQYGKKEDEITALQFPGLVLPTEDKPMVYKYKYNGKEWQDELGLNFYDYGARNYDPAIGRWMNIDPLAEQLYSNTPYNYVSNNPLNFIDPDGRSGIGTLKKDENGKEYLEISSKMYFYGGGASKEQAAATASNIQNLWNAAGGTIEMDGVTYDVKFSISGEYVSEQDAEDMAKSNGNNAENNFIRVEDGSQLSFKSSFYDTPGNSGFFISGELKKHSIDAHEYGHGLGWFEAGEADGGRHDATIENGVPGIMSPRGTPVSDEYGYGGQPSGQRTVSPYRRNVLSSDITKLNISTTTLKQSGSVNVGTASNNIYNANGTVKTP
jgi:RHS repeat-associated protein